MVSNYDFYRRYKIPRFRLGENRRAASLSKLRIFRAIHQEKRQNLHHAVFCSARDSDWQIQKYD